MNFKNIGKGAGKAKIQINPANNVIKLGQAKMPNAPVLVRISDKCFIGNYIAIQEEDLLRENITRIISLERPLRFVPSTAVSYSYSFPSSEREKSLEKFAFLTEKICGYFVQARVVLIIGRTDLVSNLAALVLMKSTNSGLAKIDIDLLSKSTYLYQSNMLNPDDINLLKNMDFAVDVMNGSFRNRVLNLATLQDREQNNSIYAGLQSFLLYMRELQESQQVELAKMATYSCRACGEQLFHSAHKAMLSRDNANCRFAKAFTIEPNAYFLEYFRESPFEEEILVNCNGCHRNVGSAFAGHTAYQCTCDAHYGLQLKIFILIQEKAVKSSSENFLKTIYKKLFG